MLHFSGSSYIQTSTNVSSVSISKGVDTHRLQVQLQLQATGLEPGTLCICPWTCIRPGTAILLAVQPTSAADPVPPQRGHLRAATDPAD